MATCTGYSTQLWLMALTAVLLISTTTAAECGHTCTLEDLTLDCWRDNIDYYSDIILEAVNQRAIVANHIGEWKRLRGLAIVDNSRVDSVLARISSRNPGPLPPSAIYNIFGAIVNETAAYEENFQGKPAMYQCLIKSALSGVSSQMAADASGPESSRLLVAVIVCQGVLLVVLAVALLCIFLKLRRMEVLR